MTGKQSWQSDYTAFCLIMILFAVTLGCRSRPSGNGDTRILKTGWYYVTNSAAGVERGLASGSSSSKKNYYLDPDPILTASDFTSLTVEQSPFGQDTLWLLVVRLNQVGKEAFRAATADSKGLDLAFVVDNELFNVVRIQAEIPSGILHIRKKEFSRSDAEVLKARIEASR